MKWLSTAWLIIRDVLLTGMGLWIIGQQARSPHPSDVLLVVAMGLTTPAAWDKARAVLSPPRESRTSSSSPSPGESPSPRSGPPE